MPSYADGSGAVITGLTYQPGGTPQLVITFDGPLQASPSNPLQEPTNTSNYSVQEPGANPEVVTDVASSVPITSASYNSTTDQVTLNLQSPLTQGTVYRVFVNGTANLTASPTPGLIDDKGNPIDGDYDETPSGDFYALFAWTEAGTPLTFSDSAGDPVTLNLTGPGQLEAWRALDGDFTASKWESQVNLPAGSIQQLVVVGGILGQTVLSGSVPANSNGTEPIVTIPPPVGAGVTFTNQLPSYFQVAPSPPAVPSSPIPVVGTAKNLPYQLEIKPVAATLPAVQDPVIAQDNVAGSPFDGDWLIFGGRTNGLHNFNPADSFPPEDQNFNITVVDPRTWKTWTEAWSSTDVPAALIPPLYSVAQEFVQQGDTLYVVGGYGAAEQNDGSFAAYTTYDTLTALSVDGMIRAVTQDGDVANLSQIQQIQNSQLQVTGGQMGMLGNQAYLVMGQNFQGDYFGTPSTQTYTDEIRSFQIQYNGAVPGSLQITNNQVQVQHDEENLRRRDYNLGNILLPNQQPALEIFSGVFTPGNNSLPSGTAWQTPVVIDGTGATSVLPYQQYFDQYDSPHFGLFDGNTDAMYTVTLGGLSLYHYNFATGQLTANSTVPFVNDVATLAQDADGTIQEYEMPSQLPGLYGAGARFFLSPSAAQYSNGVINLDQIHQPTTLGYMYGGIFSKVPSTTDQSTQTAATGAVFQVELVPTNIAPAISSGSSTTFTAGPNSFLVSATGSPTPSLSESGTLPPGITFTDNGNGTAALSGSLASNATGTYHLTITAHNGVGADVTQSFTLTVQEAPPSPPPPPTLKQPPLLAFYNALLRGTETVNANGTTTVTDRWFGFPLLVSTFDSSGNLENVTYLGINVTFLFELL